MDSAKMMEKMNEAPSFVMDVCCFTESLCYLFDVLTGRA